MYHAFFALVLSRSIYGKKARVSVLNRRPCLIAFRLRENLVTKPNTSDNAAADSMLNETMSLVFGKRPERFTAYLHGSSQWYDEYEPVVKARLPVYLAIGKNYEYHFFIS